MKYLVLLTCLYFCMTVTTTVTAPPTTSSPASCPDGWIDGGHLGCFYFHYERKLNWVEAQGSCEMLGGYLAEIKNEEQNNFIESMAIIAENFYGVKSWWLGLSDMGHEGRWMWSHSSTDAEFTSWGPAHPNQSPGNQDDCVAITLSEHFHWKDLSCSESHHSSPSPICQRDVEGVTTTEPAPTTTTFPGCPNDWSQYQNSCYKLMRSEKTWSAARDHCRTLGTELTSIHSQDESTFVYNLINGQTSNEVWIGGTDEQSEGNYEWLDGSAWDYENWISGQPDGSSNLADQDSLAMDPENAGQWRDLFDTQNTYYFLCKMY